MKRHKKRSLFYMGQRYFRALVSPDFIFFCDYRESDENSAVLMFTKRGRLVSDNYFASVGLLDEVEAGNYKASPMMRYCIKHHFKEQE